MLARLWCLYELTLADEQKEVQVGDRFLGVNRVKPSTSFNPNIKVENGAELCTYIYIYIHTSVYAAYVYNEYL